jgi:hypothetical protein
MCEDALVCELVLSIRVCSVLYMYSRLVSMWLLGGHTNGRSRLSHLLDFQGGIPVQPATSIRSAKVSTAGLSIFISPPNFFPACAVLCCDIRQPLDVM